MQCSSMSLRFTGTIQCEVGEQVGKHGCYSEHYSSQNLYSHQICRQDVINIATLRHVTILHQHYHMCCKSVIMQCQLLSKLCIVLHG